MVVVVLLLLPTITRATPKTGARTRLLMRHFSILYLSIWDSTAPVNQPASQSYTLRLMTATETAKKRGFMMITLSWGARELPKRRNVVAIATISPMQQRHRHDHHIIHSYIHIHIKYVCHGTGGLR